MGVKSIELLLLLIACCKFAAKRIHQIAQFQFKKYKIFPASEGGTCPLRHPPPIRPGHRQIYALISRYRLSLNSLYSQTQLFTSLDPNEFEMGTIIHLGVN